MLRRIIWLSAAALLLAAPALAGNPPAIEWQRTFGEPDTWLDDALLLPTGDCVVSGEISHPPDTLHPRPFLAKLSPTGQTQWLHTYAHAGMTESASWICQSASGGYFFLAGGGNTTLTFVVVHTDSLGDTLWTYVNEASFPHWTGAGLCPTSDGGCVVSGFGVDDTMFLLRLSSTGSHVWIRKYVEGEYRDWTAARLPIRQTADGGFIIGSRLLRKTNALGQQVWAKSYGQVDAVFDVVQTPDGSYAATGVGSSIGARTEKDMYQLALLRVSAQGTQQWLRLRSLTKHGSQGLSIACTSDGGYIVGGGRWYWDHDPLRCPRDCVLVHVRAQRLLLG